MIPSKSIAANLEKLLSQWQAASESQRLELYEKTFSEPSARDGRNFRRIYLKRCGHVHLPPGSSQLCSFFHKLHQIQNNVCKACTVNDSTQCVLSPVQKEAFALLPNQFQASLLRELNNYKNKAQLLSTLHDGRAGAWTFILLFDSGLRRDILHFLEEDQKVLLADTIHQLQTEAPDKWMNGGWTIATSALLNDPSESPNCSCCNERYEALESTIIQLVCREHTCCDGCLQRNYYKKDCMCCSS
jgi:hypothetical protein